MKRYEVDIKATPQIANEVQRMIELFYNDIKKTGLNNVGLNECFDFIKKMKYSRDFPRPELVSRVKYYNKLDGYDCKKKSVLLGSYAKVNNIPYRLVISGNDPKKDFHHIFIQLYMGGRWINADCTYKIGKIGKQKKVGKYMIINKKRGYYE